MADVIKIKKGLNIRMSGEAAKEFAPSAQSKSMGFDPSDFHGLVPKPALKVGDEVKVGTVLFYDKRVPALQVVSPVSGKLTAVNRGDRRKILDFVVENDFKAEKAPVKPFDGTSAETAKQSLADAGMLVFFKQRPYDVVVNPADTPRAIFVSTFDKAPLAPDMDFVLVKELSELQAGVDAVAKIAPVYVGVAQGSALNGRIKNAVVTAFDGPYPASNVGVQINHVAPISKGETVWTITPQELVMIGRYAMRGVLDFSKVVAYTGEGASTPAYYRVLQGSPVAAVTEANVARGDKFRIIAGNPLSGFKTSENGWLNPFVSQITVLPEGDHADELLGWIMPRFSKFSVAGSFLSGLMPARLRDKIKFGFDARVLGGERHMIMSGEYDRVFPMDIYPEQLIKSIIAFDIDKMEALGIYEVVPEDFAAAEFVCSSKMELQKIVRDGLDAMRREMC